MKRPGTLLERAAGSRRPVRGERGRGYLKKQYKAERGREWVRSARRGRTMPQNEHIELFQKRYGKRLDHEERTRKKEARAVHTKAKYAQKVRASFT